MENKKRLRICVEIDEVTEELLKERVEYLQSKRPGSKVTVSDAVRHALSYTGYKRGKNPSGKDRLYLEYHYADTQIYDKLR